MSGSGAPIPNRIVTFMELNFSQNWELFGLPDYDGFVNWRLIETEGEQVGSISITRSDGKVLSFFGQHADHRIGRASDADSPSDHIAAAEQLARDGVSDQGNFRGCGEMSFREPLPFRQFPTSRLEIRRRDAGQQGRPVAVSEHHGISFGHERRRNHRVDQRFAVIQTIAADVWQRPA